ncbi:MAG TPA: SRPBCC family protein [Solimonas sp.]
MNRIRPVLIAGLWLGVLLSAPAGAKVLDSSANGFTIENSVTVPVDAATAWNALTSDVGRWWPADHTWTGKATNLSIQARAGGCFCEIDGAHQAQHMTVTYTEPGKLLRMVGGLGPLQGMGLSGTMEWRLAPADGGGTRITLWYRAGGYTPDDISKFVPVVDQVQAIQLGGLGDYLRKLER